MDDKLVCLIADEVLANMKLGPEHRVQVERYARRAAVNVLSRCNREDMPPALQVTTQQITEDMLRLDNAVAAPEQAEGDAADGSEQEVASISVGDTSISYRAKITAQEAAKATAYKQAAEFLKDYNTALRKFTRPNIPRSRHEPS